MKEIWKEIEGFDKYFVSNLGRVKSMKGKSISRLLIQANTNWGYMKIGLFKSGKQHSFCVHRLVAQAFVPNPHGKKIVNHIDGSRTNNLPENLEWVTHRENISHSFLPKSKTNFVGVCNPTTSTKKYRAAINVGGKDIHIGLYKTALEASRAYLTFCKKNNIVNKYALGTESKAKSPDKPKRVSKKQKIAALTQKYIITSRA